MNINEATKSQMRAWPEGKKLTLLRQNRMLSENIAKETTKDELSRLFFDSCPLIIFGVFAPLFISDI